MKILIIGGAGFIGTNIARELVDEHEIVAYDNITRNALKFFNEVSENKKFSLINGDVLDKEELEKSMKGCDIVMHLAAIAGVSSYYKEPVKTMHVNFLGTLNALEAAKKTKPKLFVNFSTSETYGINADHVKETDETKQGPVGELRFTYAVSKLAAEHLCFAYYKKFGLPIVSLRPFNIYGPGQVGEGAIQRFVTKAIRNEPIEITGDGKQVRSWCYISDMTDAVKKCISKKACIGETFNIGSSDTAVTINELAEMIVQLSNSKSEISHVPSKDADVLYRVPNVDKAEKILGWTAKVGLKEGIKESIKWYEENDKAG